jgi:hypothetical protein
MHQQGSTRDLEVHPNKMNKEESSSLRKSWKLLLQTLKKLKKDPFSKAK